MSVKYSVIFAFMVIVYASAFPAVPSDTELIDPKYGDQPIVDTGVVTTGGFFDSPFEIFQGMEGMMKRMREQLNALLNRFGQSSGNDTIPDLSGLGFPLIPDVDLGKGNTTSVTKVINGQKVVINETRYGKENENGGAFFKVRVIEVKPEKPGQDGTANAAAPRDVESIENSQENEIQKKVETEANYGTLAPFDDFDFTLPRKFVPISNRWSNLEDFDDEENRIDGPLAQPIKPYDLSRDTYVNNILAARGYPRNPDAEFIGAQNSIPKSRMFDNIQGGHDLSRDIWVNRLVANRAVDPDAELLQSNTKRFEKYINPR